MAPKDSYRGGAATGGRVQKSSNTQRGSPTFSKTLCGPRMYREAAMPKRKSSKWLEVESEVHRPTRLLMVFLGIPFLFTGTFAFLAFGGNAHAGMPRWLAMLLAAATALIGAIPLLWGIVTFIFPAYVRHAAIDVMLDVPTDPVIGGGSSVHGSAPHELVEDAQGWQCVRL